MNSIACGTALDQRCQFVRGHVTDKHQVRRNIGWQLFQRLDEVVDSLARSVGGRTGDNEGIRRNAFGRKIRRFVCVPLSLVALVNSDRPRGGHAQERRPHLQEPAPYCFTNAIDPVDSRIEVTHPRHWVQETQVADDAAIGDNF